jgi:hypothetical protein
LLSTNEDLLESSVRNKNPQFLFQTKASNSNDDNFYLFKIEFRKIMLQRGVQLSLYR